MRKSTPAGPAFPTPAVLAAARSRHRRMAPGSEAGRTEASITRRYLVECTGTVISPGFWIEHGEIANPVNEVTIAGIFNDMFVNLTPADDLEFRYGTNAPAIRVDGMTVAGV